MRFIIYFISSRYITGSRETYRFAIIATFLQIYINK